MSIPLTINGVTYNYPTLGDENWGQDATNWAVGITQLTNTIETILNNTVLSGIFEFGDGSAATPSLRFQNSLSTGLYRVGADILGFSAAGVAAGQISSGGLLQWTDGSAAAPAFSFSADINTGMYRIGADQLGFSTAGLVALSIDASQNVSITGDLVAGGAITLTDLTVTGNTILGNANTDTITVNAEFISNLVPDVTSTYDFGSTTKRWRDIFAARYAYVDTIYTSTGAMTSPSHSFAGDIDTGIFQRVANEVNITCQAIETARFSRTFVAFYTNLLQLGNNVAGEVNTLLCNNNSGALQLTGASGTTFGANLILYGSAHATKPNEIEFLSGLTVTGGISSAGAWTVGASGSAQTHIVNGSSLRLVSSTNTGPTVDALQSGTIANNQSTPAVVFTKPASTNEAILVHYSIVRGATRETGSMHMVNNGVLADVEVESVGLGDCGVTFSADISAGSVRLLYTSTNTGTAGTIKYWLARWEH